jgi:hypothetical protein
MDAGVYGPPPNPLLKIQTCLDITHLHSAWVAGSASFHRIQWRTQEFCSGGVQKIQLRTERTGIWRQYPPSQGFWRQL